MYKINPQKLKKYNSTRRRKVRYTLCQAPFTNLYFSRTGAIVSCCYNRDQILGHYPEQTPAEIWDSTNSKQFRKTLKNKAFEKGCEVCLREFNDGNYNGVIAKHFDFLHRKRHYPVMMEFELDNTCNLECIMCQGDLSSSIRKKRDNKSKTQTPYDEKFIDHIKPWLKKAELLRFSGGEPFLIDLYYKIWDYTLQHNPKCKFYVQTNGTILNSKIEEYIATGKFDLGISIDTLNSEKFAKIRKNAELQEVLSNLNRFIALRKNEAGLVISCTVLRENWEDIVDVMDFALEKRAEIVFNTVWTPLEHAIHNLKSEELQRIIEFYKDNRITVADNLSEHNSTMFEALIKQIENWIIMAKRKESVLSEIQSLKNEQIVSKIRNKLYNSSLDETIVEKFESLIVALKETQCYRKKLEIIYFYDITLAISILREYKINDLIKKLNEQVY
jgi:MoaA/NifB/PqqE/SkfB family radical SAM enzyme